MGIKSNWVAMGNGLNDREIKLNSNKELCFVQEGVFQIIDTHRIDFIPHPEIAPVYNHSTKELTIPIKNQGKMFDQGNENGDVLHQIKYFGHGNHKQVIAMDYTKNGTQLCVPVDVDENGVDVEVAEDLEATYKHGVHLSMLFGHNSLYPPGETYTHRLRFNALNHVTDYPGVSGYVNNPAGLRPGKYEIMVNRQSSSNESDTFKEDNIVHFEVPITEENPAGFDLTFDIEPHYTGDVNGKYISFKCGSNGPCDPLQSVGAFETAQNGIIGQNFQCFLTNKGGGNVGTIRTPPDESITSIDGVSYLPATSASNVAAAYVAGTDSAMGFVLKESKFGDGVQKEFKIYTDLNDGTYEIEFVNDRRNRFSNYDMLPYVGLKTEGRDIGHDGDVTYYNTVSLKLEFTVSNNSSSRQNIRNLLENERKQRTANAPRKLLMNLK